MPNKSGKNKPRQFKVPNKAPARIKAPKTKLGIKNAQVVKATGSKNQSKRREARMKLYKAIQVHGGLRSTQYPLTQPADAQASGVGLTSQIAPVAPVRFSNARSLVDNYALSLYRPGYAMSSYIDESHVCPAPTGVLHGVPRDSTYTNAKYFAVFCCPSTAHAASASLAQLRAGYSAVEKDAADTVDLDAIGGNAGTWSGAWGNTTAAVRLFAWSMRLDIALKIPEAIVQGNIWIGNANVASVIGAKISDIIQMSTIMEAEVPGKTYCIKNSINERGLVHQPYGTYSAAQYPMDERVSWIIFGPGSAGSISGTAPTQVAFIIEPHCNYIWVPAFQPQVTGATAPLVEDNSRIELNAPEITEAANCTGFNATQPNCELPKTLSGPIRGSDSSYLDTTDIANMKRYHMASSGGQNRRVLESLKKQARYTPTGSSNIGNVGTMQMVTDTAILPPSFESNVSDIQYYLDNCLQRWGDTSSYPEAILTALQTWVDKSNELIAVMQSFSEGVVRLSEVKQSCSMTKEYIHGGRSMVFRTPEGENMNQIITRFVTEFSKKTPARDTSIDRSVDRSFRTHK